MTNTNTAEQWGQLWRNAPGRVKELMFDVDKAEKGLPWLTSLKWLAGRDCRTLNTIEIGAGAGTVSAVFARHGAHVTVLDYSREALDTNKALFDSLGLTQEAIQANALDLPKSLLGNFDVAMSFGLAEHFEGTNRSRIIGAHFDLLKPGGLALLTVPNRHCWPYRLWKARREKTGRWPFGLEVPYSRSELKSICQSIGVEQIEIIGTPFLKSMEFVLPFARWKRSIEKRVLKERRFNPNRIVEETTSVLGKHFGYALILIGRK